MTVKEFREELEFYDDEAEVIFTLEDDVDCELNPVFICGINGNCNIDLCVKE